PLDVRDVAIGDLARVATLPDRSVLRGQAEGVPAHRPQDAQAVAAAKVCEDVAQRVVEDVAHVQVAGRIGQHLEHVELLALLPGRRVVPVKGALVLPDALPLRLDRLWVVRLHRLPPDTKRPLVARGRREAVAAFAAFASCSTREAAASPRTLASVHRRQEVWDGRIHEAEPAGR